MCEGCTTKVKAEEALDQRRVDKANVSLLMLATASGASNERDRVFDAVAHCEEAEEVTGMAAPTCAGVYVTTLLKFEEAAELQGAPEKIVESRSLAASTRMRSARWLRSNRFQKTPKW